MRIFRDFIEAYNEVERELFHNGIVYDTQTWQNKQVAGDDGFKTKELMGYTFIVRHPELQPFIIYKGLNAKWLKSEFDERISNGYVNPGVAWEHRRDIWLDFLTQERLFDYTYSERIGSQVDEVIELLTKIPSSRHGIISIYEGFLDRDRRDGKKRTPCTMYYLVTVRDNKVQMLYNIRSNDFSTHFPYDITLARMLQEHIAEKLGRECGDFIYQSGSLHAFKKDNKEIF